ncbi:MAG: GTP pyrophosphokinase family protein [Candidatus Coproplasma sp.]
MNEKDRLIIEDFRKAREDFVQLEDVVYEKLCALVKSSGIQTLSIEHRVKGEASLAGKLVRNGDWYQKFDDLTDILGARVICFFNDEVDKLGKLIEENFSIDWKNSSDKRMLIKANTFGYLSLHYICYLSSDSGYPENICNKKFEIQIRTILQHTWAAIEHDIGYKSEFGLPREYARGFSRVAGLLEIADAEFIRLRDGMKAYTDDVRIRIKENRASDVAINTVSLTEYVTHNQPMCELLDRIAEINGAEIKAVSPDNYIEQLRWFGVTTIGELQDMTGRNCDLAFKLAENTLKATDIDILSSSVGLWYICRAELINKKYTAEKIAEFLSVSFKDEERAKRQAKRFYDRYIGAKGND